MINDWLGQSLDSQGPRGTNWGGDLRLSKLETIVIAKTIVYAVIVLFGVQFPGIGVSAEVEPPHGIIKEFETTESLKEWANKAHGGAKYLEFNNRKRQFIAVSMRHTWGAPSSEALLFTFRNGRWMA